MCCGNDGVCLCVCARAHHQHSEKSSPCLNVHGITHRSHTCVTCDEYIMRVGIPNAMRTKHIDSGCSSTKCNWMPLNGIILWTRIFGMRPWVLRSLEMHTGNMHSKRICTFHLRHMSRVYTISHTDTFDVHCLINTLNGLRIYITN